MTILLTPHKDYTKQFENYIEHYKLSGRLFDDREINLKPKHERSCRFCMKSHPEVTFKKKAHLIPELLGNKIFFSDFECDQCNLLFGTYETELANYLGISRTLNHAKGKAGIPSFSSPGASIQARAKFLLNETAIVVSRKDIGNDEIQIDSENGTYTLRIKRNSFVPRKVYQAILKIALSLISNEQIADYKLTLDFLMNGKGPLLSGYAIQGYTLPYGFNLPPHAFLFEKRDESSKRPTHVMALYFQNSIFALSIPLNRNDIWIYKDAKKLSLELYPPVFTQFTAVDHLQLSPFNEDFSSEDKVKDSIQEIQFKMDPKSLKNAAVYDSATGITSVTPFNAKEIVEIVMQENTGPVDPAQLFQALRNSK